MPDFATIGTTIAMVMAIATGTNIGTTVNRITKKQANIAGFFVPPVVQILKYPAYGIGKAC